MKSDEIRIWNSSLGRMIDFDDLNPNDKSDNGKSDLALSIELLQIADKYGFETMSYIGINDCFDVKIFERDILEDDTEIYEIVWDPIRAAYGLLHHRSKWPKRVGLVLEIDNGHLEMLKVIGHRYDKPHLISHIVHEKTLSFIKGELEKWKCEVTDSDIYPDAHKYAGPNIENNIGFIYDSRVYTTRILHGTLEETINNATLWSCCGVEVTGHQRVIMRCPECKENL